MEEEAGYDTAAVAGAALATIFFPLIALIAALLLMGGQTDPRKRSQLRTWAWVSGAFVALGALVVVLALVTWS
jgi:fumarate reductase subunit D